jgi:hypothetical protein
MTLHPKSRETAEAYLRRHFPKVNIGQFLGGGTDGDVWSTDRKTAIKSLKEIGGYYNERDTYLRLQEYGVTRQLNGFWIPELHGYDDELRVVEMDLMQQPPYIIDFAKVRIDRPPEFSDDVLEEQDRRGRERFEHNWPKVLSLLAALESFQIYYLDPQPGNITFPDKR